MFTEWEESCTAVDVQQEEETQQRVEMQKSLHTAYLPSLSPVLQVRGCNISDEERPFSVLCIFQFESCAPLC